MILHVIINTLAEEWILRFSDSKNSITILDIKKIDNSNCRVLIEVTNVDRSEEDLKGKFTRVSKNKFMGTINITSKLMEIMSKYMIIRGDLIQGVIRWSIILNGYEELRRLLRELSEGGYNVKVLKVVKLSKKELLTPKQERILLVALEAGYFDYPRKVGLRELARELNMSPSNLLEIIRRAEKKVILNYFRLKE
ncbi:MAG: helix-turn-helix domain-containing protein [Sulfolobaceae archaeon]